MGACLGLHLSGRGGHARPDDLVAAGTVNHVALSDGPGLGRVAGQHPGRVAWLEPAGRPAGRVQLLERTGDRELLPVAAAFGLSVCAWAPMAGGILTGKYTAAPPPWKTSRRAPANQVRLSEGNRQIARAVDGVADELGSTLARVALAWVRQRDRRIIPIVGVRALEQLENVLGCLELRLPGRAAGPPGRGEPDGARVPLRAAPGDPKASWSTATSSPRSTCHRRRPSDGDRRRRQVGKGT